MQAIEEGEYVVVKETGRRARVVSKQSNGALLFNSMILGNRARPFLIVVAPLDTHALAPVSYM